MSLSADQLQSEVENIAGREGKLRRELDQQRYLTTDPNVQEQHSKRLGILGLTAKELVLDILAMLNQPRSSKSKATLWISKRLHLWEYRGIHRENLRKHLVNAALMQLEVHLLKERTDSNLTWFEEAANVPDSRSEIRNHSKQFERLLLSAPISLSALNLRTIASALRSWSDELSVAATGISGWLEAAIPVSRDLRYLANYYHTRWLWKSVTDSHVKGGWRARVVILVKAVFDSAFRLLSGYGLRGRRFIFSLIFIIMLFAMGFYAVNVFAGCQSWWSPNSWINLVASLAFLVGDGATAPDPHANVTCPGTGYIFGAIGVTETGVGYLMLGIFVSLLYAIIQRRSIDTSSITLPGKRKPTSVTQIAENVSVLESSTLEVNTEIDAPPAPANSDGDPSDPDSNTSS